jgi:hypothetical protein
MAEVKGYARRSGPLKRSLTSPTLSGYVVTREPITDAQGRLQLDAKGKMKFGPETILRRDDGSPVVTSNADPHPKSVRPIGGRVVRPGEPHGTDEAQHRLTASRGLLRGLR